MIKLGDKVKCKITGFTGIVVAKTEFLNGCIQYNVAPKVTKDNKYPEDINIDENSLEVINKKVPPRRRKSSNGGASTKGFSMKGY